MGSGLKQETVGTMGFRWGTRTVFRKMKCHTLKDPFLKQETSMLCQDMSCEVSYVLY